MIRLLLLALLLSACTPRDLLYDDPPVPDLEVRELTCEHQLHVGPEDAPFRLTWWETPERPGVECEKRAGGWCKRWRWASPGDVCDTKTVGWYIAEDV